MNRLGMKVDMSNGNVADVLNATGLNWGTVKRDLGWRNEKTGEYSGIENRYAVLRTDNGAVLDTGVSDKFYTNHNRELIQFCMDLKKEGVNVDRIRSIDGGRYIVAYAPIEGAKNLKPGLKDPIALRLRMTLPHVSGVGISSSIEMLRLVCTNGLTRKSWNNVFRMSHRSEFGATARQQALAALSVVPKVKREVEQMGQLADIPARRQDVQAWAHELTTGERVLRQIMGEQETGADVLEQVTMATTAKTLTTDDLNRAGKSIIDSITNSPGWDTAPGTWWAALNGATYYYDHLYGRSEESRATAGILGPTSGAKERALELAYRYAGVEVTKQ